eukprot:655537-Prymnesium_polylepis.1
MCATFQNTQPFQNIWRLKTRRSVDLHPNSPFIDSFVAAPLIWAYTWRTVGSLKLCTLAHPPGRLAVDYSSSGKATANRQVVGVGCGIARGRLRPD